MIVCRLGGEKAKILVHGAVSEALLCPSAGKPAGMTPPPTGGTYIQTERGNLDKGLPSRILLCFPEEGLPSRQGACVRIGGQGCPVVENRSPQQPCRPG